MKSNINVDTLLKELKYLSRNLWWTWNQNAQEIFSELSHHLWENSNHNAVAVLESMSEQELKARLLDSDFALRIQKTINEFKEYISFERTWSSTHAMIFKNNPVAYFSAEFGLHECLRIYSGGLGILAGDHAKSASDLGLPFIGISLFYRQGYFQQSIGADGWQEEKYPLQDPKKLPIELLTDEKGNPLEIIVQIAHSNVKLHAWRLNVGRAFIYLLDANVPGNEEHYRDLTARVYGGDITTRIGQEIVLGIGGVKLLRALKIYPSVYHMNEGHSAFLTFELLREHFEHKKDIKSAIEEVKKHCIFTTHTPVPAGHDRFTKELMEYSFSSYCKSLNLTIDEMMRFGKVNPKDEEETFCMTVLALKMSRSANGVSELHGEVSRKMWHTLYTDKSVDKVPIGHITNGVHVLGWMTKRTRDFWQKHLGENWAYHLKQKDFWQKVSEPNFLSDEEIWALRYTLRRDLIEFVRGRLKEQHTRVGGDGVSIFDNVLSPDALTIGFARRFATYKRAPLIFDNLDKVIQLFSNTKTPIQMVFAGKAHPRDDKGKEYLQQIIDITKNHHFFGKVVFIENYDINVARHLISGCDLWLNNPQRPLEASGTSGQKIAIHGGLNLSILDGWWREAYDGTNGWAIGEDKSLDDAEEQYKLDAKNLYDTLTTKVIPEFFDREQEIPRKWIRRVRRAMETLIYQYNTDRMVSEYVEKYYLERK